MLAASTPKSPLSTLPPTIFDVARPCQNGVGRRRLDHKEIEMLSPIGAACAILVIVIGILGIWTQNGRKPPVWRDED